MWYATLTHACAYRRDVRRKLVHNHPGPGIEKICGRDLLDNHAVNVISATFTGLVVAWAALCVWPAGAMGSVQ